LGYEVLKTTTPTLATVLVPGLHPDGGEAAATAVVHATVSSLEKACRQHEVLATSAGRIRTKSRWFPTGRPGAPSGQHVI